ncbi:hypothetical protein M2138_000383 [Dysgonomonadaceae bacterium PH5-43]|nr:hypothetical protein [Dysgonomonadaceae bacterium PH5-43]
MITNLSYLKKQILLCFCVIMTPIAYGNYSGDINQLTVQVNSSQSSLTPFASETNNDYANNELITYGPGPGGDPTGGTPIASGIGILFVLVLTYALCMFIRSAYQCKPQQ